MSNNELIQQPKPLPPDFDVVDPITFRRDLLLEREDDIEEENLLKRFTIALALGMNELKDIDWAQHQLTKGGPPTMKKHMGNYVGMGASFSRLTAGIIVELGKSIVTAKGSGLLQSKTFKDALAKAPSPSRRTWNATVFSFTQREHSEQPRRDAPFVDRVITWMTYIRNNTFHFGHKDQFKLLAKGYELKFTAPIDAEKGNDCLYVSLGQTQEETRFYFADAAIATLLQRKSEELALTEKDIRSFVRNLLNALRFVVEALLKHFDTLTPSD